MQHNLFSPFSSRLVPFVIYSTLLTAANCCGPVQARIGQTSSDYMSSANTKFKLAKQTSTSLVYSILISEQENRVSSGFAAGATISLRDGKVSGQSIAIRIGSNSYTGKVLAAAHILDFVYEAIGKSVAAMNKPSMEEEILKYKAAVTQAMAGRAQELRYKGFNYNIKISSNQAGSVMAFILPGPPPATGNKPARTR